LLPITAVIVRGLPGSPLPGETCVYRARMSVRLVRAVAALAGVLTVPALGLLSATPTVAATAPPVRYGLALFNPPGNDLPISNAKLNAEYVTVVNASKATHLLTGWVVKDSYGHRFVFPAFSLRPGKSVRLRTGQGRNTTTDLYWGQTETYIWNNDGDTATLLNAKGRPVDTCSWTKKARNGRTSC
jgi:hypothetical protein